MKESYRRELFSLFCSAMAMGMTQNTYALVGGAVQLLLLPAAVLPPSTVLPRISDSVASIAASSAAACSLLLLVFSTVSHCFLECGRFFASIIRSFTALLFLAVTVTVF